MIPNAFGRVLCSISDEALQLRGLSKTPFSLRPKVVCGDIQQETKQG